MSTVSQVLHDPDICLVITPDGLHTQRVTPALLVACQPPPPDLGVTS